MEQIQQVLSYFSIYSPLELRHMSYHGAKFCILSRRSLPPGFGTTVTLIFVSLSFWEHWRWPDRNYLRCKKRWKSLFCNINLLDWVHCLKCFFYTTFRELNLLPSSGEGLSLERQFFIIYFIIIVVLPWPGFEPANFFVRQFFGLLVRKSITSRPQGCRGLLSICGLEFRTTSDPKNWRTKTFAGSNPSYGKTTKK